MGRRVSMVMTIETGRWLFGVFYIPSRKKPNMLLEYAIHKYNKRKVNEIFKEPLFE